MSKTITSEILVAYSQCPRKAFLLMYTQTPGTPHEYIKILEQQRQDNQRKYLDILQKKNLDVQSYSQNTLRGGNDFLINALLEANGLTADCAILTKLKTPSALGRYSYEPTIFVGTHSIKVEQKLELYFVGYVLEQLQKKRPAAGRIIGLDEKSYTVKLENYRKTLIPLLEPLQELAAASSPEPPALILNKHCPICQFQSLCRMQANQEDNLSLLDGISTLKVINKYEKKGIFTVKQLSYIFKLRKRKKRVKNPPAITHKPELQALAIREKKIYLQEIPQLTRQPAELTLDIEGIPDQQFYYLIGLLVSEDDITTYHSFWADTPEDEAQMWQQFLAKASQYPNAPIYHYGSFEPRAFAKLAKHHNTDTDGLTKRLININKHVFGKVYFPVYSNRLKEIGAFIGATWTSADASGLQSLVWRHYWDETRSAKYKDLLLTYNQEDCQALKLLTDELSRIKYSANTLSEVDFANQPKRRSTKAGEWIHSQFEKMLKFAHTNYDKTKINFKLQPQDDEKTKNEKKEKSSKRHQQKIRIKPKPGKVVQVTQRKVCPIHKNEPLIPTKRTSKRLIIDLILMKNGIKKTTTLYLGVKEYCRICQKDYIPPDITKYWKVQSYGHGFKAWIVYQRVALRLSYGNLIETVKEHFKEKIPPSFIPRAMQDLSKYYAKTEESIAQRILESPFIHVDETTINIKGVNQYVWIFTDGKHVIFKLWETREATIVQKFLVGYKGVMISDFYPGYDSIQCQQQKCWVHLIRDVNSDLWANPFDAEFEFFVLEVKNLIIPIMEVVQKYGLRKKNLNKFKKPVDNFYKKMITDKRYRSELTIKYQDRFIRYQDSLFTFLEQDGIPWHNNTAENAIRYLAIQRDMSTHFCEDVARDYLVLLGIQQTFRFQGKSFFEFLFSGQTDLDKFVTRSVKHMHRNLNNS